MELRRYLLLVSLLILPLAISNNLMAQGASEQYGSATYYGDEFHGKKTASGEKYNKNELTCAHKSLPYGTKLRVTRLDNKKSVVVRVNDRGPYIKGYIVDLSRKAASDIGMLDDGVVKVKVEVVDKKTAVKKDTDEAQTSTPAKPDERSTESGQTTKTGGLAKPTNAAVPDREAPKPDKSDKKETKSTEKKPEKKYEPKLVTTKDFKTFDIYQIEIKSPEKKGYGVQVATMANAENVFEEIAKLQGSFPNKVLVSIEPSKTEEDKPLYKLILGPYPDKKTAERNQKNATKKGYKKSFIVDLTETK